MRDNRSTGILSNVKKYTHCQRSAIAQRSLFRKVIMEWFKFHTIWSEGIRELSDAEAGRFLKAVCDFIDSGEIQSLSGTERIMFSIALKQLKRDAEHSAKVSSVRAEARRGKSLENEEKITNDINSYQMISNENKNKNSCIKNKELRIKNKELRERDIEKESADAQPAPEKKPQKHRHGNYQHVLLTDEQFSQLQADHPTKANLYIQKLDDYLENNPSKHYANHKLTISNWIEKDEQEEAQRKKQQPQQVNQYPDMYARLKAEGVIQ